MKSYLTMKEKSGPLNFIQSWFGPILSWVFENTQNSEVNEINKTLSI